MGLLVFSGGVDWYVGLSGALHGYAIYLAAYSGGRAVFGLVTAVVAAKVGWESWQGASAALEAMVGGRVLVVTHLYGAVTGLTLALIVRMRARPPAPAKA
ncbi:hypothetical protein H0Z60_02900 [Ectothiorhodospiraceae bacterium WFHF3C12]|nr:hypothetical protein [Ectothiorhodospiraceae bacterium WFHF3C12]